MSDEMYEVQSKEWIKLASSTDEPTIIEVEATVIVVADKPQDKRTVSAAKLPGGGIWCCFNNNEREVELSLTRAGAEALSYLLLDLLGEETSPQVWTVNLLTSCFGGKK